MLILSQDGTHFMYFETSTTFNIERVINLSYIYANFPDNKTICLAEYALEDDAKEAWKSLINACLKYCLSFVNLDVEIGAEDLLYQLPPEKQ